MYFLGHLDFVDEHSVNNTADLLCKVKGFLKRNEIVNKMWEKKERLLLNLAIEKKSSRNLGPWG